MTHCSHSIFCVKIHLCFLLLFIIESVRSQQNQSHKLKGLRLYRILIKIHDTERLKLRDEHYKRCFIQGDYYQKTFLRKCIKWQQGGRRNTYGIWPQDHESELDLSQNLFIGKNFRYSKDKRFQGLFKIVSPLFHLLKASVFN